MKMENNNAEVRETLENVLNEKEVMEMFGVSKQTMWKLRTKDMLPFLQVTRNNRLYLESDIMGWLKDNRKVLNKHE